MQRRTHKGCHDTNQLDDGLQPLWADDHLVWDSLPNGEIPQPKQFNVGIIRVVSLLRGVSEFYIRMVRL